MRQLANEYDPKQSAIGVEWLCTIDRSRSAEIRQIDIIIIASGSVVASTDIARECEQRRDLSIETNSGCRKDDLVWGCDIA